MYRPSESDVKDLVLASATADLTYDHVGATLGELPRGWNADEQQLHLGQGEVVFRRAVEALQGWKQFDLTWVWPVSTGVDVEPGNEFAFLARTFGLWSVNICRIVYVVDETDVSGARYGFGYGTVVPHAVRGEEQFWLRWDRETDVVVFSIRKFSLPSGPIFSLLAPLTRAIQRRFTSAALGRLAAEVTP